jgi:hypothetical protein
MNWSEIRRNKNNRIYEKNSAETKLNDVEFSFTAVTDRKNAGKYNAWVSARLAFGKYFLVNESADSMDDAMAIIETEFAKISEEVAGMSENETRNHLIKQVIR